MDFIRIGEYFCASRITGPTHNLLQIRISNSTQIPPQIEQLPAVGGCRHEPLVEADVAAKVLEGVVEANNELGSSFSVTHIRYVENDTKPEAIYAALAFRIIERIHSGETFREGQVPTPPA